MTTPQAQAVARALHDQFCGWNQEHGEGIDHVEDWLPDAVTAIEALRSSYDSKKLVAVLNAKKSTETIVVAVERALDAVLGPKVEEQ